MKNVKKLFMMNRNTIGTFRMIPGGGGGGGGGDLVPTIQKSSKDDGL